jgi:hypothetical protein
MRQDGARGILILWQGQYPGKAGRPLREKEKL